MSDEGRIDPSARATRGEVELFADRSSVAAGETLRVYVNASSRVTGSVWRLGYEPSGRGRRVADLGAWDAPRQPPPSFEASTGLVACDRWEPTVSVPIEADWKSGVYAVRFDTSADPVRSAEAIFVVRPRSTPDVVVNVPVTTWAAYNLWGSRSLYAGGAFNGLPAASEVSFDRPMSPQVTPLWELEQGHPFYTWEYPLVRWIEREGFDVGYVTNVDLHRGDLPAGRLLVSAGHDEYWSPEMRATLERALGAGMSLFWAGANGLCWSVRFDSSAIGEDRAMTCYKDPWPDPLMATAPERATGRWAEWPLSWPESDTLGVRWVDWDWALNRRPAAWIARATTHPVFEGTGLSSGDRVAGVIGDEWDAFDPTSAVASKITILGESEELNGANVGPSRGHTVLHRNDGGGLVFASGTTSWCWGLDTTSVPDRETAEDPRLQRLTRNFFKAAIEGADW